ncbi:MAG: hypothetical protein AAF171_02850 [Cyanobacteria bacterium P01_A01_bin.116]
MGEALTGSGRVYIEQQRYAEANEVLEQSLEIWQQIDLPDMQERTAELLVRSLNEMKQVSSPADYQQQCQSTAQATALFPVAFCSQ